MRNRRMVAGIGLIVALTVSGASGATEFEGRPNNPYGVMMSMAGADFSDWCAIQYQLAEDLLGEWGHVRVGSGVHTVDVRAAIRTLALCRAHKLIPVVTGLYVPEEYRIPGGGDNAPYVRTDGYPLAVERYGEWVDGIAAQGAVVPFYELGNEINGKWEPEAYGRYASAVSARLKSAMPGLRFTTAGLAGNGAGFLDEVLTAWPELKNHVDCWGLHPYGANHPPSYELDGYCLKGHQWTAEALAKHGIDEPRFVMTESGYELENRRDHRFPRITDELRADYLVEAYETFWVPDPRVVAQMIFMIQDINYVGWNGWIFVRPDGTRTRTYEALAAVPKPQGSDWMPRGDGVIRGMVRDAVSGDGLERVYVYTTPGIYAAHTDSDGRYEIDGIPDGEYRVHWFRDGFAEPAPIAAMTVAAGRPAAIDLELTRVGLLGRDLEGGGSVANGWGAVEPSGEVPAAHYAMDAGEAHAGRSSQRLTARPGGNPVGIWQCTGYATCIPDRAYAAEIWVKGRGVNRGAGAGITLTLSATDSFAGDLSTAKVTLPLDGDFDWRPLSIVVQPVPMARRLVVKVEFDAEAGEVWLDQPYCYVATYPVPSRETPGKDGVGTVTGVVESDHEVRIADAVVCLNPGAYWAKTRSDGTFAIDGVPAGLYDLWSFHHDRESAVVRDITIAAGAETGQDVFMPKWPASRDVVNGGFEGPGLEMAALVGWKRWGEFDGVSMTGWHPELPDHPDGVAARTGRGFAGSITGSNVKNGGIRQTVAVDPGKTYEASAWVYTYQSDEGATGDVASRIGLDPGGEADPDGPYVIWTPFRPSHGEWSRISARARALDDRMTIFLEQRQVHGLAWNLNVFDDVEFREVEPLEPPIVVPLDHAGAETRGQT